MRSDMQSPSLGDVDGTHGDLLRAHLDTIERRLIEQALQRSDGIVAHAARLLGLRRTTLVEKLRKFSLVAIDTGASDS